MKNGLIFFILSAPTVGLLAHVWFYLILIPLVRACERDVVLDVNVDVVGKPVLELVERDGVRDVNQVGGACGLAQVQDLVS